VSDHDQAGAAGGHHHLPDKVVFLIERAREFDAADEGMATDLGSNVIADSMVEVLEGQRDDESINEFLGFISSLNIDEQMDLVGPYVARPR
jgi:hypothetical protein